MGTAQHRDRGPGWGGLGLAGLVAIVGCGLGGGCGGGGGRMSVAEEARWHDGWSRVRDAGECAEDGRPAEAAARMMALWELAISESHQRGDLTAFNLMEPTEEALQTWPDEAAGLLCDGLTERHARLDVGVRETGLRDDEIEAWWRMGQFVHGGAMDAKLIETAKFDEGERNLRNVRPVLMAARRAAAAANRQDVLETLAPDTGEVLSEVAQGGLTVLICPVIPFVAPLVAPR